MTFDDYLAEWRRPGWLPRRLRHDARMEDRAAYAAPGKFQNTYVSAAAAMTAAADRIEELELVIRHARNALASNNEAEAWLILKNANVK